MESTPLTPRGGVVGNGGPSEHDLERRLAALEQRLDDLEGRQDAMERLLFGPLGEAA